MSRRLAALISGIVGMMFLISIWVSRLLESIPQKIADAINRSSD